MPHTGSLGFFIPCPHCTQSPAVICAASSQAPVPRQAVRHRAATPPGTPSWVKVAVQHLRTQPAPMTSGENGVSVPPEAELPMVAALGKALGMPVKAVQGSSAAPAGTRGLILRLTLDANSRSSWWLSKQNLATLHTKHYYTHSSRGIAGCAYVWPACQACCTQRCRL